MIQHLKLGPRLILAFLVPIVFLVGNGVAGLHGVHAVRAGLTTVYDDRVVPLRQLKVIADMYAVNVIDAANKAHGGQFTAEQALAAVREAKVSIEREWKAYMATTLTDREARLAEEARALFGPADRDIARLEAALAGMSGGVAGQLPQFDGPLYASVDPISAKIGELIDLQLMVAAQVNEEAAMVYARTLAVVGGLAVAAVVLCVLAGLTVARSVTKPIGQAVGVARAISEGDLTARFHSAGSDEVAELLRALQQMNDSLVRIVGSVRSGAQEVATGSVQIASASTDLSQRTEEQASSLQQTAASMEQLTAAVKQNAGTAREASRLADDARQAARKGGEVVSEVVDTMRDIESSSRRIAEIIGVIDDIAFQTNILALNAAVEAARAGMQGRGFAVVAAEVRVLAQRSAAAAKDIKDLIGASVRRVDAGARLVGEAGASVGEIVTLVQRVADLIERITTSSLEQSAGIGQVSQALTELDRVTQANAAMVEESAAAADGLRAQAASLVREVDAFRLARA
jgi:methyl-accepting chemotaxis protein